VEGQASHERTQINGLTGLQAVRIIRVAYNRTGMHDAGLPVGIMRETRRPRRCEAMDGCFD
jgi:hypothetical protein